MKVASSKSGLTVQPAGALCRNTSGGRCNAGECASIGRVQQSAGTSNGNKCLCGLELGGRRNWGSRSWSALGHRCQDARGRGHSCGAQGSPHAWRKAGWREEAIGRKRHAPSDSVHGRRGFLGLPQPRSLLVSRPSRSPPSRPGPSNPNESVSTRSDSSCAANRLTSLSKTKVGNVTPSRCTCALTSANVHPMPSSGTCARPRCVGMSTRWARLVISSR